MPDIFLYGAVGGASTLKNNLAAFWELEEASGNNRVDSTGNGHTFFEPGSPISNTTFLAGGSGNAASITGTTAFQAVGDIDFTGAYSIVMWINFGGSLPSGNRFLISMINGKQFKIQWNTGGNLDFTLVDDSFATETATVSGVTGTNTTYFIAATVTTGSNNIRLSVNNGTRGTGTKTLTITSSGTPNLVLGDSTAALDMTVDQVGIYSRVITDAEITALYNGGSGLRYSAM